MASLFVVVFGAATAIIAAWLTASCRVAAVAAAGVTLLVPYIALLYVGHRAVGITLWHLLGVALGSASLAVLLKYLLQRTK